MARRRALTKSEQMSTIRTRDTAPELALRELGWVPVHVWAHELADPGCVVARIGAVGRTLAEPPPPSYGAAPWWRCACGSDDAQVEAVEGSGGLAPTARRQLAAATVRCRSCGRSEARRPPR